MAALPENLYGFLRSGFAGCPGKPFLLRDGAATISYGDIDRLSAQVAGLLRARGVLPGERVVAQVGKSPLALALYLGCLRVGAIYVPLNTAYTAAELDYFLRDARPALFVGQLQEQPDLAGLARAADVPAWLHLEEDDCGSFAEAVAASEPDTDIATMAPDDVVAMLYTSGTTGRSKGALLTLRNLASNAASLQTLWGWQHDDLLLHALPIFHVHGLFVALHCAMLGGSSVLFHPRFDCAAVRADLHRATVMMGVPTFYTRLLADPAFGAASCHNMRLFISGSAPLLPASFEAFAERSGHRILERYGMTEAGMISSNPLHGERIAGTVGYALPEVRIRVVDASGRALPPGEIGEVEISGPNVFAGYWRQPEKTAAAFRPDGYLRSGDLGSLAADGRLTLAGRATDLIISGGYNIYPKEIENCLDALDGIAESAVIGVPHADLGEAVLAVLVPAGEPPDADQVMAALARRLARFKRPRRIVWLPQLPRNSMGKVQKQLLRERFAHSFD